jgi:hypothetical protein
MLRTVFIGAMMQMARKVSCQADGQGAAVRSGSHACFDDF